MSARKGALGFDGRGDRVLRAWKRDEEGVALGVDLPPAVLVERRTQDSLVLGERLLVVITQLFQQAGRALDVREQEGDRAARELRPSAHR